LLRSVWEDGDDRGFVLETLESGVEVKEGGGSSTNNSPPKDRGVHAGANVKLGLRAALVAVRYPSETAKRETVAREGLYLVHTRRERLG
jgi:hypothetical protein